MMTHAAFTQKLTKARPEDAPYGAFTCGKNTYMRTWGLKRGRAFARRGRIFGNLRYTGISEHLVLNGELSQRNV